MRDMHNNVTVLCAIPPKAVGTTGAGNGSLSNIIDRRNYDSCEFVFDYGTSASAVDTLNVIMYESDSSTASTFTSVADAYLLGTESAAGIAAGAKVSGSTQNVAKSIGYAGLKRYVRARVYATGTATGLISAVAVLGKEHSTQAVYA